LGFANQFGEALNQLGLLHLVRDFGDADPPHARPRVFFSQPRAIRKRRGR